MRTLSLVSLSLFSAAYASPESYAGHTILHVVPRSFKEMSALRELRPARINPERGAATATRKIDKNA